MTAGKGSVYLTDAAAHRPAVMLKQRMGPPLRKNLSICAGFRVLPIQLDDFAQLILL